MLPPVELNARTGGNHPAIGDHLAIDQHFGVAATLDQEAIPITRRREQHAAPFGTAILNGCGTEPARTQQTRVHEREHERQQRATRNDVSENYAGKSITPDVRTHCLSPSG